MATRNTKRVEQGRQTYLGYKAAQKRVVEKSTSTGPVDAEAAGLSTIEVLRLRAEKARAEKAARLARAAEGPSTIERLRAKAWR